MPRGRAFAMILLPLLAVLPAAQTAVAQFDLFQSLAPEPAKPPAKPTPASAAQKKAAPPKPVPVPRPAPAAALKKPDAKTLDAKKLDKKPDKKLGTKPEPPKYTLADYYRVWDIDATTTRKDIVARFGEPQRVGDSERKPFYYFNDALTFFFTADDTVGTMIVGNSFEPMPPKAIPPDVIDKAFIGRKRDDVLRTFGPAMVVSSDNLRYLPKTGAYKVEFQCYDFKGYVCGQMLVQF